jgi:hypothetical protein
MCCVCYKFCVCSYFAGISLAAIDAGLRQTPHHGRMQELLMQYMAAAGGP